MLRKLIHMEPTGSDVPNYIDIANVCLNIVYLLYILNLQNLNVAAVCIGPKIGIYKICLP